jgi:hypothetical protein
MTKPKFFSGPPSNKATASTVAAAMATLFWTIAAHTFWKTVNTADLTLYISTSTIVLTAIVGFAVPESAAYTQHSIDRLAAPAHVATGTGTTDSATTSTIQAIEAKLQQIQVQQNAIVARLGMTATTSIPAARG